MMNISSLTVSGQCSSGKSTLSKLLAQKFSWNYVNVGKEFKRLSAKYGLLIENFGSLPEYVLRGIDVQNEERIKSEKNIIWDGRLTCFLAYKHKKVFKVYCHANLDIRAQRTAQRDNISLNKAKQKILAREQEENKVYKRLYGISELFNMQWIDLVVDTSFDSPENLSLKVIKAVRGL